MRSTGTGSALRWAEGAAPEGYLLGWGGVTAEREEALVGLPGSGDAVGSGLGASLPHLCRHLLLAAGNYLQCGALPLHQLVQRAPQLPDRAPVSAGPGAPRGWTRSFPGEVAA